MVQGLAVEVMVVLFVDEVKADGASANDIKLSVLLVLLYL